MVIRLLAVVALAGGTPLAVTAQGPAWRVEVEEARALERAAQEAGRRGDNEEYLRNIERAVALRPHHPYLIYQLADARFLTSDTVGALDALSEIAEMGIAIRPQDEPDFAPLADDPRFKRIVGRLEDNGTPSDRSSVAFTLPEADFLPEGVAADPETGAFFVSSVRRKIIARVVDGRVASLLEVDPVLSPMGMIFDRERRILWVAASAVAEGLGTDSVSFGTAALLAFDPHTGERRGRWDAPEDGGRHWFGDVTMGPDGTIYVSDSLGPAVFRLTDAGVLEPLPSSEDLLSPQGVAATADGSALYVADYSTGITRLDLRDGGLRVLDYPADRTLLGIDGIYLIGHDRLIAVQNGVTPTRILEIRLTPDGDSIADVATLDSHRAMEDPTLGVVAADAFWYVANSQWSKFAPDRAGAEKASDPTILRLALGGGADPVDARPGVGDARHGG
ncbi:MAG TPA: hypothetical protein VJ997_12320 [Longimicrobiales bacterium]|nr:hypothetical protein [Longimicrobiales bacterium]